MLNEKQIEKNYNDYKRFISSYIARDGVENLLSWLDEKSDAKIAPASTKYHGSYAGGFIEYSLKVFYRLIDLLKLEYPDKIEKNAKTGEETAVSTNPYSKETIAFVALLHAINKINYYAVDYKNVKDEKGNWNKVPYYRVSDNAMFYGEAPDNAIYTLQQFFSVSYEESIAIKYCMGLIGNDSKFAEANMFKAYRLSRLAMLLNQAIMYVICDNDVEDN